MGCVLCVTCRRNLTRQRRHGERTAPGVRRKGARAEGLPRFKKRSCEERGIQELASLRSSEACLLAFLTSALASASGANPGHRKLRRTVNVHRVAQRPTICPLTGTTTLGNSASLVSMMMDPFTGPTGIVLRFKVTSA